MSCQVLGRRWVLQRRNNRHLGEHVRCVLPRVRQLRGGPQDGLHPVDGRTGRSTAPSGDHGLPPSAGGTRRAPATSGVDGPSPTTNRCLSRAAGSSRQSISCAAAFQPRLQTPTESISPSSAPPWASSAAAAVPPPSAAAATFQVPGATAHVRSTGATEVVLLRPSSVCLTTSSI